MFRLGIYDGDEAREIAGYLKAAGIKVELKTSLDSQMRYAEFLEGRMSELKGELKYPGDYERSNRYITAAREVLKRGVAPEEFVQQLALQLDPAIMEKRGEIKKIIESCSCPVDDADEDSREEEVREVIGDRRYNELIKDLSDIILAEGFIDVVLRRNEIELGKDIGDRLDDPVVRIPVDLSDYEEGHRLARLTTFLILMPATEINVDEFSIAMSNELDEDFREDYPEEAIQIAGLGKLLEDLVEDSAPGWTGLEEFALNCDLEVEDNGNILRIDGVSAAKELARVLEKNGLLKIKGDSIKWKK